MEKNIKEKLCEKSRETDTVDCRWNIIVHHGDEKFTLRYINIFYNMTYCSHIIYFMIFEISLRMQDLKKL